MSKKAQLIAALVLTSVSFATPGNAATSNILQNPGFETGGLSPWFNGNNFGGSDWSVTSVNVHSGSYAATTFGNVELEQDFAAIAAFEISQVSFYIQDTAQFNAYDFLYSDGTDNEYVLDPSADSYSFFDVTSNLNTSKSLTGFAIYGSSRGTTYLDDVTIDAPSPSVPEPATWAMMLTGMGSIGFAMRSRRNGVTAKA